jgi:hypothetical protein
MVLRQFPGGLPAQPRHSGGGFSNRRHIVADQLQFARVPLAGCFRHFMRLPGGCDNRRVFKNRGGDREQAPGEFVQILVHVLAS